MAKKTAAKETNVVVNTQCTVNKAYDGKIYATDMSNKRLPSLLISAKDLTDDSLPLPEDGHGFVVELIGRKVLNETSEGGKFLTVPSAKILSVEKLTAQKATKSEFDEKAYLKSLEELEDVPY